MAGGREYSAHQRKIINRYYEHRDTIRSHKLGELVSDLSLCTDDKARERLWKRAIELLTKCGANPARIEQVSSMRDVGALARLIGELEKGQG